MNIKEICPVHKKCGGCHYQGVSYEEQLRVKEKMVGKLMGKFCKVHPLSEWKIHIITGIRSMRFLTETAEEILFPAFIKKEPIR